MNVPPGRSRVGAALLNLSGLCLGHLYLGRRRRAAAHLAVTAALVTAAFLTDAAANPWPWRAVGGYWLAWLAADAWWQAAKTPRPARRNPATALAGVVLVGAVVAGLLAYGAAGRSAYDAARAAVAHGDCATAMDRYDLLTGPFELTLADTVRRAPAERDVCEEYVAATIIGQLGDTDEAISRYQEIVRSHPFDALLPSVGRRLADTYLGTAREHRRAQRFVQAIDVYRKLLADGAARMNRPAVRTELADTYLREAESWATGGSPNFPNLVGNLRLIMSEFPDTPAAAKVPEVVADAFAVAVQPMTVGRPCDSVTALNQFAELDAQLAAPIAGQLGPHRAQAGYQCGIALFTGGQYAQAIPHLESFLAAYGTDAAAPQARSALIAARVAAQTYFPLSLPPPYGGDAPGTIEVTFYNDSQRATHVLLAGATAHEFVLPPCGGCPVEYAPGAQTCPTLAGRPSHTLRLQEGLYHFMTVEQEGNGIATLRDTLSVTPFFRHTMCLFVQQRG